MLLDDLVQGRDGLLVLALEMGLVAVHEEGCLVRLGPKGTRPGEKKGRENREEKDLSGKQAGNKGACASEDADPEPRKVERTLWHPAIPPAQEGRASRGKFGVPANITETNRGVNFRSTPRSGLRLPGRKGVDYYSERLTVHAGRRDEGGRGQGPLRTPSIVRSEQLAQAGQSWTPPLVLMYKVLSGSIIPHSQEDAMANARKITSVILGTAIICALAVLAGPNPAAQAAEKPIVIGASISLNGAYARTGEYQRRGYEMWVESVNARGGLHGRKIELKYYDDKSDPNEAAKLYERLITVDKVDLLLGPYSSPVTKAAAPIAEKYKIPMVSTGAADQAIFRQGFKYIFQTYTPENFYMDGVLEMAAKAGYKTMAAVNEDTVFAKGTAEGGIAKGNSSASRSSSARRTRKA